MTVTIKTDFNRKILHFAIFIILALHWNPILSAQMTPGSMPFPMGNIPILTTPQYAKFVGDRDDAVFWGSESGLRVYNLDAKKIIAETLPGERITALAVNPFNRNQAYVACAEGTAWIVDFNGESLASAQISALSSHPVGVIRVFVFNPVDKNKILAADSKRIFLSLDGGKSWETSKPIHFDDEDFLIRSIIQDPYDQNKFLVATTPINRYRGDWQLGSALEQFEEKALPHGYRLESWGESYILIGKNADLFGFKYMNYLVLDLITSSYDKQEFFAAGMGNSPIRIIRAPKNKIRIYDLNTNLKLTFSIDVSASSPQNMILTTTGGIYQSKDGGETWTSVTKK